MNNNTYQSQLTESEIELLKTVVSYGLIYVLIIVFIMVIIYIFNSKKKKKQLQKEQEEFELDKPFIEKIQELNSGYDYKVLNFPDLYRHQAWSIYKLKELTSEDVIFYMLDHNTENIKEFIQNIVYNKQLLDKYRKEFYSIIGENKRLLKYKKIPGSRGINIEVFYKYRKPKWVKYYGGYWKYEERKIFEINQEELIELYNRYKDNNSRMDKANRERKQMSQSLRYDIIKRDGGKCVICGRTPEDGIKLQIDHIIPVSKGGKTEFDNLQTLCEDCNKGKLDKDDDEIKEKCPECGNSLVLREGETGKFYGCSEYPKCKYTRRMN